MKLLIAVLLLLITSAGTISAQKFSVDSTGKTGYKQVYRFSTKVKFEDVFEVTENWFKTNTAKFTQINAEPPMDAEKAEKNKNKQTVDREFNNNTPLQSIDPAGGKMVALGIVKYYGANTKSIRLIYIKYDMNIQIKGNYMSLYFTNVRYFHFNPKTFAQAQIYGFSGGQPCELSGTIDELNACQTFGDEYKELATYFNKQLTGLGMDLKNTLKEKKVLYDPKEIMVASVPKTGAKKTTTTSKAPAKTPTTPAKTPAKTTATPAAKAPVKTVTPAKK